MADASSQIYNCYFLMSKLLEKITVDNGYHNTIASTNILYQQPPLVTKRNPPILYIYHDRVDITGGTSGYYDADINYSLIAETGVKTGENDLLTEILKLESDILTVFESDLYFVTVSTEQSINISLDHHVIYSINTEGGLAYPKALLEFQGIMSLKRVQLSSL